MTGISLRNVSKVYPGGVRVVDGLSFAVNPEEFMVLVGPSGCGKSTTLRMIAGLEDVSGGDVLIGERVVNDDPPKDRDIAMVFQNYALYPHMTAFDNMAFALKLRRWQLGLSKADIAARVNEAARILRIEPLLSRKPRALSGGERQRVALGRALVRRPRAFLFDEPLSNVDAKARVDMRAEIKRLQRQFRTTSVYVTHDQEEAMSLGDRILVMKGGRIQHLGTPREVYDRPANRFVAGFVGTPPMSFIDGRIEAGPTGPAFVDGPLRLDLPAAWRGALASRAGQSVVLGIRPEAMSLGEGGAALELRVSLIEHLGAHQDVHATTVSGRSLLGRFPVSAGLREGEACRVSLDLSRCHLFEPGEFGANLTAAGP